MAGAVNAALFLQEFVAAGVPWIHLDLFGWNRGRRRAARSARRRSACARCTRWSRRGSRRRRNVRAIARTARPGLSRSAPASARLGRSLASAR